MTIHIVTFAPPTPNGGLHVGHLSGPYLAADVFTRAKRLVGEEVVFISYSDDYQSYLHRKGFEISKDIKTLAKQNFKLIDKALKKCSIAADAFIPALDNPNYLEAVKFFYRSVQNNLKVKKHAIPYCSKCDLWGYEAYGQGRCQECGSKSDHSQCESCAMPPDITGISEVQCTICQKNMVERIVEREFLDLSGFKEKLAKIYANKTLRNQFKQYIQRILNLDRIEWPIDRPNDFGIPCEAAKFKLIHTWFAGIAGYYAASQEVADKSIWKAKDLTISHFIGFDCSFSHAVVYPFLLNAAGIEPKSINVYTNAFLKLNGEDFSTSRGIAIWADEILQEVDSDYFRFYLALVAPENEERNFDTDELVQFTNQQLHQALETIVERCNNYQSDGKEISLSRQKFIEKMKQQWLENTATECFSMNALAQNLFDDLKKIRDLNWSSRSELLIVFVAWCSLARPLMPSWTSQVLNALEISSEDVSDWLRGHKQFPVIKQQLPGDILAGKKPLSADKMSKFKWS